MARRAKVLIEQYDNGHMTITVGKKVVFSDNGDQFNTWTMVDVLAAAGIDWNHECREGAGGENECEDTSRID